MRWQELKEVIIDVETTLNGRPLASEEDDTHTLSEHYAVRAT